ncbi:hypothetical protein ACRAQ6_10290 [Erythrobacter sp. HA6-11]
MVGFFKGFRTMAALAGLAMTGLFLIEVTVLWFRADSGILAQKLLTNGSIIAYVIAMLGLYTALERTGSFRHERLRLAGAAMVVGALYDLFFWQWIVRILSDGRAGSFAYFDPAAITLLFAGFALLGLAAEVAKAQSLHNELDEFV